MMKKTLIILIYYKNEKFVLNILCLYKLISNKYQLLL